MEDNVGEQAETQRRFKLWSLISNKQQENYIN